MSLRSALHRHRRRAGARWVSWSGVLFALSLAALVQAQPTGSAGAPDWADAEIRTSRVAHVDPSTLPDRPLWAAAAASLAVVVESEGPHLSLVDGERFETVHRLPLRAPVHGVPRFSPDGRFAYLASRDGWIRRHDLWNLALVAEVRAGLALRDLAISRDGRWLIAANESPHTLVLLDAQLHLVKHWVVANREGTTPSRIAAVVDAPTRQSFVVALQDIAELWEISYDPKAEDFYDGLVHDFRMGEGVPTRGFHNPRRIALPAPLTSLIFEPRLTQVAGVSRAADGSASVDLINLDARRRIGSLRLPGTPLVHAGAVFTSNGHAALAVPNLGRAEVDVIDLRTWQVLRRIQMPGPTRLVRSHANNPFAWSWSADGRHGVLTAIDQQTLAPAAQIRGDSLTHAALGRSGRHLWVSLGESGGVVAVHDTQTHKELARLPMRQPKAVYIVGNQIETPDPSASR